VRHVADRIADLRRLQRQLRQLRGLCAKPGQAERCGILNAMSRASKGAGTAGASAHVHGTHRRRGSDPSRAMNK
jgi:hypothetical protein